MQNNSTIQFHTGNRMPVLGLGTWKLTKDTTDVVKQAFNFGYRMVDTSSDYGTQEAIGQAIKKHELNRDDIFVVTKIEEDDKAQEACQEYLTEMDLDYADLIVIHRPPKNGVGEDLWQGLIEVQKAGYAKDIGVSNYDTEQISALIQMTGVTPVVNQIEWSPFGHSQEMTNFCEEHNIIIQAYSPLTRGTRLDDPVLEEIAQKHDKSPAQILLRWNIQRGSVPIPKANSSDHLAENIEVFDFQLSPEDMEKLNQLNEEYSALGGLPYV